MFQLKENLEDIINFVSNSKDISKRDIDVLNKLAYGFSKIPKTYTLPDACKVPNSLGFSLDIINLFTYMSYVFNTQPIELIKLWIDDRILFLPGSLKSRTLNIKNITFQFIQKHRYNIQYIVADDLEKHSLKFITDKDDIKDKLYHYNNVDDYIIKYANNKPYIVKKESSAESIQYLTNIEILHNTKKIIKELSGVTNKEYKELTDHFINKSDLSLYPIPIQFDLYDTYIPIIKKFSSIYNIKVNEYLIIYVVMEKLGKILHENMFKLYSKYAFEKLYNRNLEKEHIFILSEFVKKRVEEGLLSDKWFKS